MGIAGYFPRDKEAGNWSCSLTCIYNAEIKSCWRPLSYNYARRNVQLITEVASRLHYLTRGAGVMTGPKHLDSYTGVSDSISLNYIAIGNCCKILEVTTHASRIRSLVHPATTLPLTPLAADRMGSNNKLPSIHSVYLVMGSYQVQCTGSEEQLW
jgi:hypothetical protein